MGDLRAGFFFVPFKQCFVCKKGQRIVVVYKKYENISGNLCKIGEIEQDMQ